MTLAPTPLEQDRRTFVVNAVLSAVREDRRILLPPFDKQLSRPGSVAMQTVGVEPNDFGGTVGPYRYQFEGEDDLLHVLVVRQDGGDLSPGEGQAVVAYLLPNLPSALIWLKPGRVSQHFYFGHDELLR